MLLFYEKKCNVLRQKNINPWERIFDVNLYRKIKYKKIFVIRVFK